MLVNLFLYNINLPRGGNTRCPSRVDFLAKVFPQLEELQATVLKEVAAGISGAINTDASISPADGGIPIDDNTAIGNSATANISGISADGVSAAGITAAVSNTSVGKSLAVEHGGKSPMLVEGSQDDEGMMDLQQLKLSVSEEELSGGGGGAGAGGNVQDEHRKQLINLTKTRQLLSLSLSLSVCLLVAVCLSVLSVCLSVCMSICLSSLVSVLLVVRDLTSIHSVCLSICVSLSVCLSVYVSVCLSVVIYVLVHSKHVILVTVSN